MSVADWELWKVKLGRNTCLGLTETECKALGGPCASEAEVKP